MEFCGVTVEETVNGMRYDSFLVDSEMLSEEILQPRKTQEEEQQIIESIISVLDQKNRLPD